MRLKNKIYKDEGLFKYITYWYKQASEIKEQQ